MLTIIIFILGISFALYTLLGGADFGAGIVETFAGKRGEVTVSRAIAPVWEANHVWLILAVVILFTGFPTVYSSLSLVLHIPLMITLIGIIIRGSAFTFRHYDVVHDASHFYYSLLFKISSFITPFFLGITLGAMILGEITFSETAGFYEKFVAPWLNPFCIVMGIFSSSLFSYIASVFLVGEARTDVGKKKYARFAKRTLLLTAVTGLSVFAFASWQGHDLLSDFLRSTLSITCFVIVFALVFVMLRVLHNKNRFWLRFTVGSQVAFILLGWFAIQYPVLINVKDGEAFTFYNTQAPQATLLQLLIALAVGLVLVTPAFYFLFKVFKIKGGMHKEEQ